MKHFKKTPWEDLFDLIIAANPGASGKINASDFSIVSCTADSSKPPYDTKLMFKGNGIEATGTVTVYYRRAKIKATPPFKIPVNVHLKFPVEYNVNSDYIMGDICASTGMNLMAGTQGENCEVPDNYRVALPSMGGTAAQDIPIGTSATKDGSVRSKQVGTTIQMPYKLIAGGITAIGNIAEFVCAPSAKWETAPSSGSALLVPRDAVGASAKAANSTKKSLLMLLYQHDFKSCFDQLDHATDASYGRIGDAALAKVNAKLTAIGAGIQLTSVKLARSQSAGAIFNYAADRSVGENSKYPGRVIIDPSCITNTAGHLIGGPVSLGLSGGSWKNYNMTTALQDISFSDILDTAITRYTWTDLFTPRGPAYYFGFTDKILSAINKRLAMNGLPTLPAALPLVMASNEYYAQINLYTAPANLPLPPRASTAKGRIRIDGVQNPFPGGQITGPVYLYY